MFQKKVLNVATAKFRTKQTTEQLYKHVDGVWTDAEATAKKVCSDFLSMFIGALDKMTYLSRNSRTVFIPSFLALHIWA